MLPIHPARIRLLGSLALVSSLSVACSGFPDPTALPGRYESTKAPAVLELSAERWVLESGDLVKSGVYEVSGDRLAFVITDVNHAAFERYCRDVADVYGFSLEDGMLSFGVIEGDTCDPVAQSVLTSGPWRRAAA